MLVKIEEIQEPGLKRTEPIKPEVLNVALADSEGFVLVSSSPLSASFKKVSGRVFVRGNFSAVLVAPCKRCTTDVEVPIEVDFSIRMVPEALAPRADDSADPTAAKAPRRKYQKKEDDGQSPSAASFELDEVDAEPFNGKTIDLDPIIREQVLLALPVSVLCREDCKGLCTVCGEDLNEKDCGCERKVVDVRLAKLKEIKLN